MILSSGFRAPNIDDQSRIFESNSALRQIIVPNRDIQPEYSYNLDLGIIKVMDNTLKIDVTFFYTWFKNAIALSAFKLNGKDSIEYQGMTSKVIANQNKNKAWLYGFNASLSANLNSKFSFTSVINYTHGSYSADPLHASIIYEKQADNNYKIVDKKVSRRPLDHIPPVFGKTSFNYHQKIVEAEFFMLYNGWKKLDQYNAEGEDNAQYATVDGSPAWITYNIRTSLKIKRVYNISMAVENITDINYRYFASGFSAPGRNFIFSLKLNF
jgi:hemoglobin/transferrin/lactoferrin receptor protein